MGMSRYINRAVKRFDDWGASTPVDKIKITDAMREGQRFASSPTSIPNFNKTFGEKLDRVGENLLDGFQDVDRGQTGRIFVRNFDRVRQKLDKLNFKNKDLADEVAGRMTMNLFHTAKDYGGKLHLNDYVDDYLSKFDNYVDQVELNPSQMSLADMDDDLLDKSLFHIDEILTGDMESGALLGNYSHNRRTGKRISESENTHEMKHADNSQLVAGGDETVARVGTKEDSRKAAQEFSDAVDYMNKGDGERLERMRKEGAPERDDANKLDKISRRFRQAVEIVSEHSGHLAHGLQRMNQYVDNIKSPIMAKAKPFGELFEETGFSRQWQTLGATKAANGKTAFNDAQRVAVKRAIINGDSEEAYRITREVHGHDGVKKLDNYYDAMNDLSELQRAHGVQFGQRRRHVPRIFKDSRTAKGYWAKQTNSDPDLQKKALEYYNEGRHKDDVLTMEDFQRLDNWDYDIQMSYWAARDDLAMSKAGKTTEGHMRSLVHEELSDDEIKLLVNPLTAVSYMSDRVSKDSAARAFLRDYIGWDGQGGISQDNIKKHTRALLNTVYGADNTGKALMGVHRKDHLAETVANYVSGFTRTGYRGLLGDIDAVGRSMLLSQFFTLGQQISDTAAMVHLAGLKNTVTAANAVLRRELGKDFPADHIIHKYLDRTENIFTKDFGVIDSADTIEEKAKSFMKMFNKVSMSPMQAITRMNTDIGYAAVLMRGFQEAENLGKQGAAGAKASKYFDGLRKKHGDGHVNQLIQDLKDQKDTLTVNTYIREQLNRVMPVDEAGHAGIAHMWRGGAGEIPLRLKSFMIARMNRAYSEVIKEGYDAWKARDWGRMSNAGITAGRMLLTMGIPALAFEQFRGLAQGNREDHSAVWDAISGMTGISKYQVDVLGRDPSEIFGMMLTPIGAKVGTDVYKDVKQVWRDMADPEYNPTRNPTRTLAKIPLGGQLAQTAIDRPGRIAKTKNRIRREEEKKARIARNTSF